MQLYSSCRLILSLSFKKNRCFSSIRNQDIKQYSSSSLLFYGVHCSRFFIKSCSRKLITAHKQQKLDWKPLSEFYIVHTNLQRPAHQCKALCYNQHSFSTCKFLKIKIRDKLEINFFAKRSIASKIFNLCPNY